MCHEFFQPIIQRSNAKQLLLDTQMKTAAKQSTIQSTKQSTSIRSWAREITNKSPDTKRGKTSLYQAAIGFWFVSDWLQNLLVFFFLNIAIFSSQPTARYFWPSTKETVVEEFRELQLWNLETS